MELNIIIDDYSMNLNVPDDYIASSEASFARLDAGMDEGIQLGQEWVAEPNALQRCQAAANRLLSALESHNEGLAMLSAGYILNRREGTQRVVIDNNGDPSRTTFE
ncbi:hypothetical protein BOW51_02200 [Solemya velesiana gill symbiont]|uniref:Uncharacterized protein n=2 Tax=Solemya velesiana gill symbiont TaxID=1918948 RepID=A0A1T2KXB1_9GAMM|nr:hypothetical protein BOW51_02200 [Solemya velesiana gill symbiont]